MFPILQEAFSLFTSFVQDVQEVDEFTVSSWKATLAVVASVVTQHMKTLEAQTDGHWYRHSQFTFNT